MQSSIEAVFLFFVALAGEDAATLTVAGLPLCDSKLQPQTDVGAVRLASSLDEGCDYFQVQGAAARERLERVG